MSTQADPRLSQILIVGAGLSGMITAKTLLDDGFQDIQMVTTANAVGGKWAPGDEGKVYPGIVANSLYGCFEFSSLPMPKEDLEDDRIQGSTVKAYFQTFFETFLEGKIKVRYGQEVTSMVRRDSGSGWKLKIRTLASGGETEEEFDKVVLCVGGFHTPYVPSTIIPTDFKGICVHSSRVTPSVDAKILALPRDSTKIIVVGLGKSATDLAARYTAEGRNVTIVFDKPLLYSAASKLSGYIAKTRLLSVLFPAQELTTKVERFFHMSAFGSWLRTRIVGAVQKKSNTLLGITPNSPLAGAPGLGENGPLDLAGRASMGPTSFHALVKAGKINVVRDVRAIKISKDGKALELSDGTALPADVIVLGTGFRSSFDFIPLETRIEIGLEPVPPVDPAAAGTIAKTLPSMQNGHRHQNGHSAVEQAKGPHVHRAIVPYATLPQRDLALNGYIFSVGITYIAELTSHWISSYFLSDPFLTLPSPSEAFDLAESHNAWARARWPGKKLPFETTMKFCAAFNTDQYNDSLLLDMSLDPYRQKGGFLGSGWLLKPIDSAGIRTLGAERRALREGKGGVKTE